MDNINEDKIDLFIKSKVRKDDLISKKADDVFTNFFKNEIHKIEIKSIENTNSPKDKIVSIESIKEQKKEKEEVEAEISNKENIDTSKKEKTREYNNYNNDVKLEDRKKKISSRKKILSTAACFMILFLAANGYAATKGYNNIFFAIKNIVTNEDITDANQILSDRDITISYKNIDILDGLSIQVNKIVVKDNEASLFLTIQEDANLKKYPKEYLVYDITNKKEKLIANHETTREKHIIEDQMNVYEEKIDLSNIKDDTKQIRLEIQDNNFENLVLLEIDLENKAINIVGGYTAEMKKISEVELKEVLSKYAYLNPQFQNTDTNLKGLEAELAMDLIYQKAENDGDDISNLVYKQKDVNRAIYELTGKEIKNYLDFTSARCYYDVDDKEYKYYQVDGVSWPICLEISKISFKDGIYTVTFAYATPTEDDYIENNIENADIYESTMKFKLNEDYKYTKYCLVDLDELESKETENTVTAEIIYSPSNSVYVENTEDTDRYSNNVSKDISNTTTVSKSTNSSTKNTNTATNDSSSKNGETVDKTATVVTKATELDKINNYASTMNWNNLLFGGMNVLYPADWQTEWIVKDRVTGSDETAAETLTISGVALGKDVELNQKVYSDVIITYYPVSKVDFTDTEAYANYIASKLDTEYEGAGFLNEEDSKYNRVTWAQISKVDYEKEYFDKEIFCHVDEKGNAYIFSVESNNTSNYKYINIVNWILRGISFE